MLLLLAGLLACAPGRIAWNDGEDLVRTAFLQRSADVEGWEHARVFLSNGVFPCGLPTFDDPRAQQEALVELVAASCREDARHLLIDAWWPDSEDGTGVFPGDARAFAGDARTLGRFARASYVGIDEGTADGSSSLTPAYGIAQRVLEPALGAPGSVVVSLSDETSLRARFTFGEAHVSGTFEANVCEEPLGGTSLFAAIASWGGDPTLLCAF